MDLPLWNLIQQLPPEVRENVNHYYQQRGIPVQVREECAEFIETYWLERFVGHQEAEVAENDQFVVRLLELVRQRASESFDNGIRLSLNLAAENLQGRNPQDICIAAKDCVDNDLRVVTEFQHLYLMQPHRIPWMLHTLRFKVLLVRRDSSRLEVILNTVIRTNQEQQAILGNQERDLEAGSNEHINALAEVGVRITTHCERLLEGLGQCFQEIYTTYLKALKWGLNENLLNYIPEVSAWMQTLLDFMDWAVATSLNIQHLSFTATRTGNHEIFHNVALSMSAFREQIRNLRRELLQNVFVVSQQGPRVYRNGTAFAPRHQANDVTVKLLAGVSLFDGTEIEAVVVNEIQAMHLILDNQDPEVVVFGNDPYNAAIGNGSAQTLVSNLATFTRRLANLDSVEATFRNLAVRGRIARTYLHARRSMHEKFCLLFRARTRIDGEELVNWCCSAPFTYTVHVLQNIEGEAVMFWDETFRQQIRRPFQVTVEVPIDILLNTLNGYFNQVSNTSRNFTVENVRFLRDKISTEVGIHGDNQLVRMEQFCRSEYRTNRMNENRMTFWDWFYHTAVLVRDRLRQHWEEGYVVGFITKEAAENLLMSFMPGTLLVRFPSSEIRALNFTIRQPGGETVHYEPITDAILQVYSFPVNIISIMERGHASHICHPDGNNEYIATSIETSFRNYVEPIWRPMNPFAYVRGNPALVAYEMVAEGALAQGPPNIGLEDVNQLQFV